jgi:hypothetical protein
MPLDQTRAQQIGQMLGGLGAGIQGNLPQYQYGQMQQKQTQIAQQEKQQEMIQARQKAVFTDAEGALGLLEVEDYDALIGLGVNRLQMMQQLGVEDPSGTQRLTQLAVAARNGSDEAKTLLRDELTSKVNQGRAMGILKSPESAKGATDLGKARQDLEAGLIDESQYNALSEGILDKDEGPADQRERKIAQYQENFGLSENEAIRAVDSVFTTDANGNSILFDPITGESELLTPSYGDSSDQNPKEYDPAETEDLAIDVAGGTGAWASMLSAYNKTVGQLPFLPIAEGPEQAAAELRVLERDAIRALASSGRPPVIEQQRIMAVIPQALSFFENPEVAQLQTTNFVDLMMQQYSDDIRFSKDPSNPEKVRNTSRERANNIESIIRRVLKPDAANSMFSTTNQMIDAGSKIMEMTDEELNALDITDLTDDELDIYIERMSQGN